MKNKQLARERSHETRLRDVYHGMMGRCHNPAHPSYKNYGGRGISVCEEWNGKPAAFIQWGLSHGYKPGLQVDRIDNDCSYSPANCRFVTPAQNQHNTSQTVLDEASVSLIRRLYNAEAKTQEELARLFNVSQSRISEIVNNRSWAR